MDLKKIKYLTVEEARALFREARKASRRDHAVLLIAYRHGLRASEIGLLRREDVNFKTNRIRIHRLKGSLGGEHPLEADEARALRTYLRARKDELPPLFLSRKKGPLSRYAVDEVMKAFSAKAKVPADRRYFHVLKHSIAVHLVNAGVEVLTVRDWLGHKSINNTLVYAQLLNPKRDAEMSRVFRSKQTA
jgi:integrase